MELVRRQIQPLIEETLQWARVVMLHGARQSGKTTLARMIAESRGGTYVSMDSDGLRDFVLDDPVTFLAHQRYPMVIDEAQRGGDRLIFAVKRLVDEERTPGRFILTGSTNFLTLPTISESLAGRIQIFRLGPLSEAELAGTEPNEIEGWFNGEPSPLPASALGRADYLEKACRGGYPEIVDLAAGQRTRWFQGYIETVIQRDIVSLSDVRKVSALEPLLRWTAGLTSSQVNVSEASRRMGVSRPAITSYFEWLKTVFLVHELPAWSRGLNATAARRPKFHVSDSGLAASLLGVSADALASPSAPATGPLLETFVVNEISRQLAGSTRICTLAHFRDHKHREIDLILQTADDDVVAVEIKSTMSPASKHLSHLRWLRDRLDAVSPGSFRAGILLHTGPLTLVGGDRIHMRPIGCLWSAQ